MATQEDERSRDILRPRREGWSSGDELNVQGVLRGSDRLVEVKGMGVVPSFMAGPDNRPDGTTDAVGLELLFPPEWVGERVSFVINIDVTRLPGGREIPHGTEGGSESEQSTVEPRVYTAAEKIQEFERLRTAKPKTDNGLVQERIRRRTRHPQDSANW